MIQESRGTQKTKSDLRDIDKRAQELLKTLNGASLTTRVIIGRVLDQGIKGKGPRFFTDLADGTIDIIQATSRAKQYVKTVNHQVQYARFALACDIGEALADLTEGGMLVAGDTDVGRPEVNKNDAGILNKTFLVLHNQATGKREKWPATTLDEGLKRLQYIRALERRAQAADTTIAEAAASELAGIDRLKDAVARDCKK
jgi:hypothetical protein